jgi:hypothetical protein
MTTRPHDDDPQTPQTAYEQPPPRRRSGYQREGIAEAVTKSFMRSVAASLGRVIVRMITGRLR